MVGYNEKRSCTDILFLILFILFWIGFIVIAVVAFNSGDLRRLTHGSDFAGNICTLESNTRPNDTEVESLGAPWSKRKQLWYPLRTDMDIKSVAKLGICVDKCPEGPNIPLTEEELSNVDALMATGRVGVVTSYAIEGVAVRRDWPVLYPSKAYLHRCLPLEDEMEDYAETLFEAAVDLGPVTEVGRFLFRQFAEVKASWKVLIICAVAALVVSFIWVFLLRFVLKPLVYISLVLVMAALIILGILLWLHSNRLHDEQNDNDYIWFRVAAVASWVVAALLLCFLMCFFKSLRIAIELIRMGARVVSAVKTLIIVPLLAFILIVALVVWTLFVAVYLQSSGSLTTEELSIPANVNNTAPVQYVQSTFIEHEKAKDFLLLPVLFMFLWSSAFILAACYMVISFSAIFWYFSIPGDTKTLPFAPVPKGIWWTTRYHLGTLAFGSLIIAILRFIRILISYAQRKLKGHHDPAAMAGRFVLCCASCLLKCFEWIMDYINRNAYIVTCIDGSNFCVSAFRAVRLLSSHIIDIVVVDLLANCVLFFSKLLVVAVNVVFGYLLLKYTDLAEDAENIVLPLIIIGVGTYMVASVFMGIFETVIDALLICYCYDLEYNNGNDKPYYFTSDLRRILNKYNAEQNTPHGSPMPGVNYPMPSPAGATHTPFGSAYDVPPPMNVDRVMQAKSAPPGPITGTDTMTYSYTDTYSQPTNQRAATYYYMPQPQPPV